MPNEQGMSKRQIIRERRARSQLRNRLALIGGALVVIVACAYLYTASRRVTEPPAIERGTVDFNTAGNADASITITEYSDFQCPFCQRFWSTTEAQVFSAFVLTGQVHFVYRSLGNFISDNVARSTGVSNSESKNAAAAAYCAGDQGKFWEYHDILFANQTGEGAGGFAPEKLRLFAQKVGLDIDTFNTCLSDNKYGTRVGQDASDGEAAGAKGTPFFVIIYVVNGETRTRTIDGAQGFSAFQNEINGALGEIAAGK